MKKKQWLVAGPCAVESEKQMEVLLERIENLGLKDKITGIRGGVWKPRTKPSWEGLGIKGLKILMSKVAQWDKSKLVAVEVLLPEHVREVIKWGKQYGVRVLVWVGARNQNHFIQKEIGRVLQEGKEIIWGVMIKNPPWPDKRHWLGIKEYLRIGGYKGRIIGGHRGFAPWPGHKTDLRNIPLHKLAKTVKTKGEIPMVFDPSHVGGKREKVIEVWKEAKALEWYDGYVVEVHPFPELAKTDSQQQLTPQLLSQFMRQYWR